MPTRLPIFHAVTWLLSLSLAACAAAPSVPTASEPFCRVGGLAFHTDFEGASLHGCVAGENGPELTVAPEFAPINPSPWYAWRITNSDPQADVTAVVVTQRYQHGKHRYAPWISADSRNWERLPEARLAVADDGTATLQLEIPRGGLYVAAQPPLSSSAIGEWTLDLARQNDLRTVKVARSVRGRDIDAYLSERADHQASVVLISRQHPPEVTGALAFQDFVERLFADDELAGRFRERFAIGLVPEVNPDGVVRGHWRANVRGVDLNRDWGPFTQPETRGVAKWLARLDERAPLRLFIDFHSTDRAVLYMPHTSDDPEPKGFSAAWLDALQKRLGDDMPAWSGEHNPGLPTSKSWVRREYGVLALTYEVGDNTPRDRIREVARATAEETMKLLLEIEGFKQ